MQNKKILFIYFLLFKTIRIIAEQPSVTLINIIDPSQPRSTIVSPSTKKQQNFDSSKENNEFWLTTDLLAAEFRKGCLSTALCHEPKFKLINTMTINGEQSVMSWLINSGGNLVQDHARSFVTYWTQGDPEDIEISCQIAGTDPSFGFARVCDETPRKRVFNDAAIQRTLNVNSRWIKNSAGKVIDVSGRYQRSLLKKVGINNLNNNIIEDGEADNQMIVELRGRCFNATLAIRKHRKRCPWCPDPNLHIIVADQQSYEKDDSNNLNNFHQKISNGDALFLHNIVIVALSGAVVFCFSGFCFALLMHCRYRKKQKRKADGLIGSKAYSGAKRLLKFAPLPSEKHKNSHKQQFFPATNSVSPQMHKILEVNKRLSTGLQIEQRYETPWDNKYKSFQQQWTGSDSNSHYQTLTITRPNINNHDCAAEYVPDNIIDYSNTKFQHDLKLQNKNQQSGLSIADCSAQSNSCGSSSDASTGPSTSATTIGCASLCSNGNQCCNSAENYCINGNCINISPIVNHPAGAAALAALKQNEINGRSCGTLSRTSVTNSDYNKISVHNNGGMTLPSQSFYSYQHHHYPQFSPPAVPPPCVPVLNQNIRQDNNKIDSV